MKCQHIFSVAIFFLHIYIENIGRLNFKMVHIIHNSSFLPKCRYNIKFFFYRSDFSYISMISQSKAYQFFENDYVL